jgi:hypothetical protein
VLLRIFPRVLAGVLPRKLVRLDIGLARRALFALVELLLVSAHLALVHVNLLMGSDSDAY